MSPILVQSIKGKKKLRVSHLEAIICFIALGLVFALSFYQDSSEFTSSAPFAPISLIVPIGIYIFFIRYKKLIQSIKYAAFIGFLFGFGFFSASLYWLIQAPLNVMELGWFASLILFFILISIFSLSIVPFFIAVYLTFNSKKRNLKKAHKKHKNILVSKINQFCQKQMVIFCFILPSVWVLLEFIRAEILFMPLLHIAHPQIDNFLASFASIFGVYGIGFIVWFLTGLLFLISQIHPIRITKYLWIIIVVIACLLTYHQNQLSRDFEKEKIGNQSFAVVQGNVKQNDKFNQLSLKNEINRYFYLSSQFTDSIIIWPETAIATFKRNAEKLVKQKIEAIKENNSIILAGIVLEDQDIGLSSINSQSNYYTALAHLEDASQYYLKTKLVIFGEYIPFLEILKSILEAIETPFSSYSPGSIDQSEINLEKSKIAIGICFEGAYGRLYNRYENSNVMVNISNDAWFDGSPALAMLLNAIRYRSIEMGKFLIRSANTGISGLIDPNGKIVQYLKPYQAGGIDFDTPLLEQKTFYSRVKDWPVLGLSIIFLSLFLFSLWSNRR